LYVIIFRLHNESNSRLRNKKLNLEKSIEKLEARKLKIMEDIYKLQKQYEKQKKLNDDL